MNLPTTNLLEWIDVKIAVLKLEAKSTYLARSTRIAIIELELIKNRILQERENEKQIIEDAWVSGKESDKYGDNIWDDAAKYYQTTFNPNK